MDQCIEIAVCDAKDEYEQALGWLACFEEVYEGVDEVEVFGEVVGLAGFDCVGPVVVAICTKGKKRAKITIDSISGLDITRPHKLWLKAWKSWQNKW